MNKKNNNYIIELNGEPDNLQQQCRLFIQRLSESYNKFQKDLKDNEEKWKPYLNKELIVFTPQEIATKSPLTIIDAPWGNGKTYFIEEVGKYFFDHQYEIKKKQNIPFEKIIIIDTWKYSSSGNVVEQVMIELFSVLSSKSDKNKENWKKVGKFFWNKIVIPIANDKIGTDFDKFDEQKNFDKLINEIEKNKPKKTIIFFDNIERLGSSALDVLKAIQKLSSFNFFCFIFPLYYKKLHDISEGINGEFPIDKFINLSHFKLENDYTNLLKKEGFDNEFSKVINSCLKNDESNDNLTIREVKKIFEHNKLNILYQEKGTFDFISKFCKIINIYNKIKVKEYLSGFLNVFLTSLEEQKNIFNNEIQKLDDKEIFKIIPENIKNELIGYLWYEKNIKGIEIEKIENFFNEEIKKYNNSIANKEILFNNAMQMQYPLAKKWNEEINEETTLKSKYIELLNKNTNDQTNLYIYLIDILQKIFDIFPKTLDIINNPLKEKENKLFLELIKKWDDQELKIFSLKNDAEKNEFLDFILEIN